MIMNNELRYNLNGLLMSALHNCVRRFKDIADNPYVEDDLKVDNALKVSTLLEGLFYLAMTEDDLTEEE